MRITQNELNNCTKEQFKEWMMQYNKEIDFDIAKYGEDNTFRKFSYNYDDDILYSPGEVFYNFSRDFDTIKKQVSYWEFRNWAEFEEDVKAGKEEHWVWENGKAVCTGY